MSTGTLTLTCLVLCLGQTGTDAWYTHDRHFKIPINIAPALRQEIKGMVLYVSRDKNHSWQQEGNISSSDDGFVVHVPMDGEYWYRVASLNNQGKQDPADISTAVDTHKIIVDTLKPNVHLVSVQRQGDEVVVNWEIQETNPDTKSLKLRYRPSGATSAPWSDPVPIPTVPVGEARVKVNSGTALTFRLELKDRAGNFSFDEAGVMGDLTQAAFQGSVPFSSSPPPPPKLPEAPPKIPEGPPIAPKTFEGPPSNLFEKTPLPPTLPVLPPPPPAGKPLETIKSPPPATYYPDAGGQQTAWESGGFGAVGVPDSTKIQPPAFDPPQEVSKYQSSPAPATPQQAPARVLPPIKIVNNPKVVLQYELANVGPAGIGSIELWITKDDGQSWEPYKKDNTVNASMRGGKYTRSLDLPGQGVYGLTLVVYNQNKRAKKPAAGDVPQMRIEVDLTAPEAALWPPEPDPQMRDAVVLTWEAKDKNLAAQPITLEWAEQPNGPWQTVQANLPNTGKYSWPVPAGVPAFVFLRLRVRDQAGNEGVVVTTRAQSIDMSEPEGRLVGVGILSATEK